jgi:lambda family phage portal protein
VGNSLQKPKGADLPSPNLLDRAIAFVAPEKAAQRYRARVAVTLFQQMYGGGYIAGRNDRKALQDYNPRAKSADADVNPGLTTMRARSRDLAMNAPLATGALNTTVTSTVGSGMAAQPSIDREVIGLSEDEASAWERRARKIWRYWAERPCADFEHELTFYDLQSLGFRSALENGDVLAVKRWKERTGDPFGTRCQLIEADRVSNPNFQMDTQELAQGVETTEDGDVVRYWVQDGHPGDHLFGRLGYQWAPVPSHDPQGDRVAWLLYDKRRIGQRRGVPYLAPVVEPLKQLERYSEAELMAAVISALFTVFIKSEDGETTLPGVVPDEDDDRRGDVSLGPGTVAELLSTDEVEVVNPNRPNQQFDAFVTAIYRQVAVGLELPYEILIKHFQSSYSASRGAILEAWKFFRGRRGWLDTHFCTPFYEAVISEAVGRGWLEAPGFFDDPFLRAAYLGVHWTGDAMPQIDPLKEARASKLMVDEGFSTRERESMALNGTDWEENHQQQVKEERMRREAGFGLAPNETAPSPDPETREDVEAA